MTTYISIKDYRSLKYNLKCDCVGKVYRKNDCLLVNCVAKRKIIELYTTKTCEQFFY